MTTPHARLAALAAATLSVTALAQQAAPAGVTGQPTPEQAQQIIERITGLNAGPGAPRQLVYGGLPEGTPLSLGAPLDVLVSLRSVYGTNASTRVLLSSALDRDRALAELGRQLSAAGWKARPLVGQAYGFQAPQSDTYRSYYFEAPAGTGGSSYTADLNARETGGRTSLDLNINTAPAAQIAYLKKQPATGPQSSLPALKPLPDAKLKVSYGGGSPNGVISSVHVTGTTRSAGEVLNFYSAQLKAAGWKAVTDTSTGPLRAVTYALKDLNGREALGTLGIRPWEKTGGGYVLTVSVQGFKP